MIFGLLQVPKSKNNNEDNSAKNVFLIMKNKVSEFVNKTILFLMSPVVFFLLWDPFLKGQ